MALIKFQLHHKHADGTYQVRLSYLCEDGRYYKKPMKDDCRAKPTTWKKAAGRFIASAKNAGVLNDYLDEEEKRVYAIIKELRLIPRRVTPESIRAKEKGEKKEFWEFFAWFTSNFPPEIGPGTQKHYLKQRPLLERFEESFGRLSFQSFDQRFADELTKFMRGENYNDSTIEQTFSKIRALLNFARKYGVISAVPEFNTTAKAMDTGAVYLNNEEIQKIYASVQEERVGDGIPNDLNLYGKIFVLGTQLGLRVSDMKIGPENFIDNKKKLSVSNKKTVSEVIIPLSKLATEIFEEFDWRIPAFSEVLMNRYIKIICEIAKIDDVTIHRSVVGGKMVEEKFYKYEKITSHTMRRSFATNMFLAGVPVLVIMRITGHRTQESFMRYIRVSNTEAADIMARVMGV